LPCSSQEDTRPGRGSWDSCLTEAGCSSRPRESTTITSMSCAKQLRCRRNRKADFVMRVKESLPFQLIYGRDFLVTAVSNTSKILSINPDYSRHLPYCLAAYRLILTFARHTLPNLRSICYNSCSSAHNSKLSEALRDCILELISNDRRRCQT